MKIDEPAIRNPEPPAPDLFPICLKLEGRLCLVVGAGTVGESKIEGLLAAGAAVRVVAPSATDTVRQLARAGTIRWEARRFEPYDLDGVFLVVVATDSTDVNDCVFLEARQRGVLCNVVDDPARCDFYYPSVVRRGALQIAISTAGRSPALAQRLRRELEQQFPAAYATWVEELGRKRQKLFRRKMDRERRHRLLHRLAARERFEKFAESGFGVRDSVFAGNGAQQASRQPIQKPLPRNPNPEPRNPVVLPQPPTPDSRFPRVYLVGAGPGDPELLTLKALDVLGRADVVLHDDLVTPQVLAKVSPKASVFRVGKRCGPKRTSQEEIHALMVAYARGGLRVVRLQGGDPVIFGRAGEEVRALREAGVDFEIVPGVTSPLGAAARAGIALTERGVASSVIFLTGHPRVHDPSGLAGSDLAWPSSIRPDTTVVIYMPGDDYALLAAELSARGLDPETPCLIVSSASTACEQVHLSTVRELPRAPRLPSPKLLIVGQVVAPDRLRQREESAWAYLSAAV